MRLQFGNGSPDKAAPEEVNDSWSDVHPSKIGRSPLRSPVRKQFEEPIISASKFSVLCSDEEEEDGEIKDTISVNEVEEDTIGDEENTIGGEEDTHEVEELTVINLSEDDSHKVRLHRGTKKSQNKLLENSALVPDANPVAKSTRSSRRNL